MGKLIHLYSNNSIIILTGNGFDLACGLETGYAHFFNYLKENKQLCDVDLCGLLEKKDFQGVFDAMKNHEDLSIWECYFAANHDLEKNEWVDIEEEIRSSLSAKGFWDNVLAEMKDVVEYSGKEMHPMFKNNSVMNVLAFTILYRYKDHFAFKAPSDAEDLIGQYYFKNDYFVEALKKELTIFENKFSTFFKSMDLSNSDYLEVREQNLIYIEQLVAGVFYNHSAFRLITFNYTGGIGATDDDDSPYHTFNEVHGSIEYPILGIGGNVVSSIGYVEDFKKSNRRRLAGLPTYYDILGRDMTYNLVIYGVSFGKSDYEDFKVLLNYVGPDDTVVIVYDLFNNRPERREEIYESVRKMYITLGFAKDKDDFWLQEQMGKIIFKEIPTEDLKKIRNKNI